MYVPISRTRRRNFCRILLAKRESFNQGSEVLGIKYGNCCKAFGSVFEEIEYADIDASMYVFLSKDGIKAIGFCSFYNTTIGMQCFCRVCRGAVELLCERRTQLLHLYSASYRQHQVSQRISFALLACLLLFLRLAICGRHQNYSIEFSSKLFAEIEICSCQ